MRVDAVNIIRERQHRLKGFEVFPVAVLTGEFFDFNRSCQYP